MRFLNLAVAGLAVLFSLGCASTAEVTLDPAVDLNPNDKGQATPLEVRIYHLKGDGRFVGADFKKLWEDEKAVLAEDLITREQETLFPGKPVQKKLEMTSEVKFIGIMGLFNKEEEGWKVLKTKDEVDDFKYKFAGYKITLVKD